MGPLEKKRPSSSMRRWGHTDGEGRRANERAGWLEGGYIFTRSLRRTGRRAGGSCGAGERGADLCD